LIVGLSGIVEFGKPETLDVPVKPGTYVKMGTFYPFAGVRALPRSRNVSSRSIPERFFSATVRYRMGLYEARAALAIAPYYHNNSSEGHEHAKTTECPLVAIRQWKSQSSISRPDSIGACRSTKGIGSFPALLLWSTTCYQVIPSPDILTDIPRLELCPLLPCLTN
jgi:hypothetical protein